MEGKMDREMRRVFIVADTMTSPLGNTSAANFSNLLKRKSGIVREANGPGGDVRLCVSRIGDNTRFDTLCMDALQKLQSVGEYDPGRTLMLLSTTKGNISLIDRVASTDPQLSLHHSAQQLASSAGIRNYHVVSNACSSGVNALLVAKRFLQGGQFDHAIVIGADVLSDFVISGFKSLLALSDEPCRPFDASRKGINLGEAVGAVLLSVNERKESVCISGGAMTNDANHISSPSRTGAELASAIQQAVKEAGIDTSEIDFISAHGTATLYNDEMETKAFHAAGVHSKPVHSLKGYFGHTLGAAGLIETIMCVHSLKKQETISSLGFVDHGVSLPLNVCTNGTHMPLRKILKTASGFGGTNAAMILSI
jgi:3-oxoacyl-[acyl-carrier-protein] synthase-1